MLRQVLVWNVTALSLASAAAPAAAQTPVAAVWYRGEPAGTPQLNDLAVVRALGFSAVAWPAASMTGLAEVRRMASVVGLEVVVRPDAAPGRAALPPLAIDVLLHVSRMTGPEITATTWRAIAHGARVVLFDAGLPTGSGVEDRNGVTPDWVKPAVAIARNLRANGVLLESLAPGPRVTIDAPAPPALEVTMFDAGRSWVVIATSLAGMPVHAVIHLPAGTPYALWVNLIDSSQLAMLSQPAGPRWTFDAEPFAARVYVIDKVLK